MLISHCLTEPSVPFKAHQDLLRENSSSFQLESFAQVVLSSSLARHNQSFNELPLWKILLAIKVELQGIRLSPQTLSGSLMVTAPHQIVTSSITSIALRDTLQKKETESPLGPTDQSQWNNCLTEQAELDRLYLQLPPHRQAQFNEKLNLLNQSIQANLCSTGSLEELKTINALVRGWINQNWDQTITGHAKVMVNVYAQQALRRMNISDALGGGYNVHDLKAVIMSVTAHRGQPLALDAYVSPNRDSILQNGHSTQAHFDDALTTAELIYEASRFKESPGDVVATLPALLGAHILENSDSTALTRYRGLLVEWAVRTFADQPHTLLQLMATFQASQYDLMPAKILFLRTAARLGHYDAFKAILNAETIPMDAIEHIPGDPDQRHWLHVALLGGSRPILETIWNGLMFGQAVTDLDLPEMPERRRNLSSLKQLFWQSEPHSLLQHAANSPDDTALKFLLEKLPDHLADANHPEISNWIQQPANDGYTPLLRAAFSGNSSGVRCLLDEYARLNIISDPLTDTGIFSRSEQGQTILHCAAHSQKPDIVDMILDHPIFLSLSQTQKDDFIFAPTSSRLSSLEIASLNGDIRLLTSLLTVVLQEKTFDQKLKILAYFLHHPLDLKTLIPELSSQKVIDLSYLPIGPEVLIKLMQMATSCEKWNLTGIDLKDLTVEQVQDLNPDRLSVKSISLNRTWINPDVRIALLAKLKCESWNLKYLNLRDLTVDQVQRLKPDGLSVKSIDLSFTDINPDVRIALLVKLKCESWNLRCVDLSGLTLKQVQDLIPDGLSVKNIDLSSTKISPEVQKVFLAKLKCETWYLRNLDLSGLTVDQVQSLNPDGFSVKNIDLRLTKIKPDVLIALLAKLNCETWDLEFVDLSDLTATQVQDLIPDGLSVKNIVLIEAKIKPDVRIALLAKLNITE